MVKLNHRKYARRLGNVMLQIFLCFFPISKVISLRKEVLNFRQLEDESLGTSWDHFNELIITSPDLAIQDPVLLQHFYMGLSNDSRESIDAASRGVLNLWVAYA